MMRAAADEDVPEAATSGDANAAARGGFGSRTHPPGRVDRYQRAVELLCAALEPEELVEIIPELMASLAECTRSAPLTTSDPNAKASREGGAIGPGTSHFPWNSRGSRRTPRWRAPWRWRATRTRAARG